MASGVLRNTLHTKFQKTSGEGSAGKKGVRAMLSITKSTSTLLRLFLCITHIKYSVSRCPTPSRPKRRILSVSKELKTEVVLQIQGVMKSTVTGE